MFVANSNSIKVTIVPNYNHELSIPLEANYVWDYKVVIENRSKMTVQVVERSWQIISASGFVKEIRGQGVVGLQPFILPGEKFEYSSYTNLNAPSGVMKGAYKILSNDKEMEIEIPIFSLDSPNNELIYN